MTLPPHLFPRPRAVKDIVAVHESSPQQISIDQIFQLMYDRGAQEWGGKVGPASPTRLLCSGSWVFKARRDRLCSDLDAALARTSKSVELLRSVGIWHPRKIWFVISAEDGYWPANATPHLTTLSDMSPKDVSSLWLRFGLPLAVRTFVQHRTALDLNPSNYGWEPSSGRLYYIDDEIYYSTNLWNLVRKKRVVLS